VSVAADGSTAAFVSCHTVIKIAAASVRGKQGLVGSGCFIMRATLPARVAGNVIKCLSQPIIFRCGGRAWVWPAVGGTTFDGRVLEIDCKPEPRLCEKMGAALKARVN
jgi:hypothetical protein